MPIGSRGDGIATLVTVPTAFTFSLKGSEVFGKWFVSVVYSIMALQRLKIPNQGPIPGYHFGMDAI